MSYTLFFTKETLHNIYISIIKERKNGCEDRVMMTQWYTRAAAKGVVISGQLCLPSRLLRMSTNGNNDNTTTNNNNNHDDLDAIFKQKRILRTQVRKTLKAIDPSLRSQQGTF
jgi:5-formyltetrahydrofolate cyclo-ligase